MQLTKQQAIEQGYTHYSNKDGEYNSKLSDIENPDWSMEWYLCKKETLSPYVDDEGITELISDSIYGNEEFYDEHDLIGERVAEVLGRLKVSDAINEALSTLKYYYVSNIRLVENANIVVL